MSRRAFPGARALKPSGVFVALAILLSGCPRRGADDPSRIERARGFPAPAVVGGKRAYPVHRDIVATVFWVGEPPTSQNGCMSNYASAFDNDWIGAYGGCDSPTSRIDDGGMDRPAAFVPRENAYYLALPYGLNEDVPFQAEIPWAADQPGASTRALLKNRWVSVRAGDKTCFGQWEDVGPVCGDDVEYVMGGASPRNDGGRCDTDAKGTGTGAGIDLSPAMAACLGRGVDDTFRVEWWFVDDEAVPEGPWRRVVTRSPPRDGPRRKGGKCAREAPYPVCG